MKINSYRIKRFFSISTPSLSLPYQMALSVTSDREQFHLIMSFWSLEEKKKRIRRYFSLHILGGGCQLGKVCPAGRILHKYAQSWAQLRRWQQLWECRRAFIAMPVIIFLFFLDMAVIFKVYLKGLDKSWETRSWSQKSREGKKKRKSFPDAGLLGIPSPSISVFVSLMLAGLWNILLRVFNTGLCLSLPQKASSEPELGTATHSHPPPTRHHHHHHPTSWLNIKQLHLTFY